MATSEKDESTCAREKTFEVVLRGGSPWGFDVTGGQGEGKPLQISNVLEDGKAWESGLIQGDVLIRVNDIACLTAHESQQLINSAFRTLTLKLWRSSNTPDRASSRPSSYGQRLDEVRDTDLKQRLDAQDDSVVYNQSKSSQGFRMRPRTRRGESFNVKKPSRNRGDQDVNKLDPYKDQEIRHSASSGQIKTGQSYHSFREGKLAQAKSSPSLLNPTQENSGKNYVTTTISAAKSSPNINNDAAVNCGPIPQPSEYYNNNYERYSLDGPASPLNVSWNLGSGDFKRAYQNSQPTRNMYETTDSYDNDGKTSRSNKNTRRSLPPYMLQKYQADYENISDFGTTPLRSEKISEIVDLDSDCEDNCVLDLSSQKTEAFQSQHSPPVPPVRDPSSLRYIRVNQSHEKYPSWPVTKPSNGQDQSQPINTRTQSWTDHTNTNKEFPGKQRLAYTPGLRPLPERTSPNSERRGEEGKTRPGSDPGLKSEFVYDKFGRVRQRNYENVDQNQIKKFYESKPGYPPPQLDSDGHNLGDEKYNVPSPPERDVPLREDSGLTEKFPSAEKQAVRPTSFGNKMRDRGHSHFSASPLQSPKDPKTGPIPAPRATLEAKPREKMMVDSCTSPQRSPKHPPEQARSQHGPSSQIKSSSKAYIIKQTPYYNTSTQTDISPTSSSNLPNMQVTVPKPANSSSKSDFGSQTSPTGQRGDGFSERHPGIAPATSAATYSAQDKRSNYADIKKDSEISHGKSSRNYADYSALRSNNYADVSDFKNIHQRYASDEGLVNLDNKTQDNIPHYSEYAPNQAPILRKLSEEFYKGRMPVQYDKRHQLPQEPVPRSEPGMKEAESYSSVVIHPSESAGPFGRDDFGSRSSLSDSRHDLSSMDSPSNRSSIAKSRRSLDPSLLSQRGRDHRYNSASSSVNHPTSSQDPRYNSSSSAVNQSMGVTSPTDRTQDHRYNPTSSTVNQSNCDRYPASSSVNQSRGVSSPTERPKGPRRPHRSSDSSTPSQPKSSPDSRSSGSTHYTSSDHSRMSSSGHDQRLDSDSVFTESKSPTALVPGSVKLDSMGGSSPTDRYPASSTVNQSKGVASPSERSQDLRYNSSSSTVNQSNLSSPTDRYISTSSSVNQSKGVGSPTDRFNSASSSVNQSKGVGSPTDRYNSSSSSVNHSVFAESKSPTVRADSKDVNVNLGRKPSMKKAYGIYDETERVLRGAAATLKAVNESQNLRKAGEIYLPMNRLSRGSSDSKILDQIQEENDVFQDSENSRSRSSSGREGTRGSNSDKSKRELFNSDIAKEESRASNSDKTKQELFNSELTGQRFGMRRSTSEQLSGTTKTPASLDQQDFKDSSPDLTKKDSSTTTGRLTSGEMMKRNSESDLKKIQHQAVLNFMEIKIGKRSSSSGSQDGEGQITLSSTTTTSLKSRTSPTQSVQDLISKTSENLANRTQRADSFRRSGSSASSSRNSQDYVEMNKPRRETEWSRMRSQGVGSFSCDVDGRSNRSSLCSENPYEDIGVFLATGATGVQGDEDFTPAQHLEEAQTADIPELSEDKRIPVSGSMETNLVPSPTYQNLSTGRRRPPPPPPLLSPEDKPPALPPRNYKTQPRLHDVNTAKLPPESQVSQIQDDDNMAIDSTKIDFKSLMTQWQGSPREDRYAADLRKQARKFSEQQQQQQHNPNSTTMSIKHSKTKIGFSTSYKCEPALPHQATPPNSSNQSFEDQTRVASPDVTATEEGDKENKAPSTPGRQEEGEVMKTPPRVERSISDLPLPSPPVIYGDSVEGDNSFLPPPPPEVLEEEEKESGDRFADNSYGDYKTKKSRAPGNYQRSVSAAAVVVLENADHEHGYPEKTKLAHNAWNSESSLNGATLQPQRSHDLSQDRNIPAFKVESTLRNVVKGTTQPLVPTMHRFPGALPNTISLDALSESALRRPAPNSQTSAPRYDSTPLAPNSQASAPRFDSTPPSHFDNMKTTQDKDPGRNNNYGYEGTSPTKPLADNKCPVTAWLNKNESIANSPINPGLQPRNIHENLSIQRSKTFNQSPAQSDGKKVTSPVRNVPSQSEIKKRSTFNSPTPYGARPYQANVFSSVQNPHRTPHNNSYYSRQGDGNKITPKTNIVNNDGVSPVSGNAMSHDSVPKNTLSHDNVSKNTLSHDNVSKNNPSGYRPAYQHKADLSRDSGVGSTMTINSSASSYRYSGEFSREMKTSPSISDNKSPVHAKGGNSSEISSPFYAKGANSSDNSPIHAKGGISSDKNSPVHAKGGYPSEINSHSKGGNSSDKNSPLHTKGGNTSDKNSPVHVKGGNMSSNSSPAHGKGGNSSENKNSKTSSPSSVNQSFVVSSSSSAKPLSANSVPYSETPSNSSQNPVQSNESSLKKSRSSESVIAVGTISHGRQRSQEELECDQQAKELAKELMKEEKKLSDVLTQDSTPKRMKYMDGLFVEPVAQRKLSSDETERKLSKDGSDNSHCDSGTDQSSLPSMYFISHPKAVVEMQIRNDEEINKDINRDISSSGLVKQKEELMEKLHKKLEILRKEKIELKQEIQENDELGEKVLELVTEHTSQKPELGKFKIFIEDREKIVRLMLNLSGQLARAENAVQSLPASTNPKIKQSTIDKREKLKEKREEAMQLNTDIEKRFDPILGALEQTLGEADMEDVQYYVSMKSKLTIDLQELEDRIKLGEEQIQELKKSIPYSKTSVN